MTETNLSSSSLNVFRCRRWLTRIEVRLENGYVVWTCSRLGSTWQEQFPLSALLPYPLQITDNRSRNFAWVILLACVALSVLAILNATKLQQSPGVWVVHAFTLLAIANLAAQYALGTCHWAQFRSYLPTKTLYYFASGSNPEFLEFTNQLNNAILASQPKSTTMGPSW